MLISKVPRNEKKKEVKQQHYYNHPIRCHQRCCRKCRNMEKEKKNTHVRNCALEYQRHARKLYLYNYTLRFQVSSSDRKAKSNIHAPEKSVKSWFLER